VKGCPTRKAGESFERAIAYLLVSSGFRVTEQPHLVRLEECHARKYWRMEKLERLDFQFHKLIEFATSRA
jgi:hypothetical protein